MTKTEKKIKDYIISELTRGHFTFPMEIVQHTIWGFRGASYKNFKRAYGKVMSVISALENEKYIETMRDTEDAQPTVHKGAHFEFV